MNNTDARINVHLAANSENILCFGGYVGKGYIGCSYAFSSVFYCNFTQQVFSWPQFAKVFLRELHCYLTQQAANLDNTIIWSCCFWVTVLLSPIAEKIVNRTVTSPFVKSEFAMYLMIERTEVSNYRFRRFRVWFWLLHDLK